MPTKKGSTAVITYIIPYGGTTRESEEAMIKQVDTITAYLDDGYQLLSAVTGQGINAVMVIHTLYKPANGDDHE